ncbi:hypothetical protein C9374_007779 [Naegleria lovaniensis]|uniref:Uncharacterized protein n=1 Tax=Naegleria lovaniensis TaxID=51637 RepID=A0AA88GL44_NAELO|nr:uncharacterized protein C9374_007779 [Naegleria lovaniensis]KAG2379141.1 hypothetical protein C9374_007779 [Naegleria lovaniensis]
MQQRQHDEEEKAFRATMEHSACRGRGNSVLDHENGRIHEMGSFQGNGLRSSGISYFTPAASTSRPPTMTSSYVPYSYSYDPVRGFSATNEARDGYGLGSGAYTSAMNRFGDETQWKRQAESEANCCSRCSACSSVKETPKWQLSQDEIQQKSNPLQGRDLMEKYKIEDDKQFRPYSPDTKSVLTRLIGYKGESVTP